MALKKAILATVLAGILSTSTAFTAQDVLAAAPAGLVATAAVPAAKGSPPVSIPSLANRVSGKLKKVFALYWPEDPLSWDNKPASSDQYVCYTSPTCQTAYSKYGGIQRDRPIPRDPLPADSDWQLTNAKIEITQAMNSGIDGYLLDLLSLMQPDAYNHKRIATMLNAATQVSADVAKSNPSLKGKNAFPMILMPDNDIYNGSKGCSAGKTNGSPLPAADVARALSEFTSSPAVYKIDGKVVIAPFSADQACASYWQQIHDILKSTYKVDTVLIPILNVDNAKYSPSFRDLAITWGVSWWGGGDARSVKIGTSIQEPGDLMHGTKNDKVKHARKNWVPSIRVQDVRPAQSWYEEAGNSETLVANWQAAMDTKADMAFLMTWNDYTETTNFAPSVQHGWSVLDLNSYYQTRFQTGKTPAITRESVFLSHRIQPVAMTPTWKDYILKQYTDADGNIVPATIMTQHEPGKDKLTPRDTVEVRTFLKAGANLVVTVGTKTYKASATAGVWAKTFPLGIGKVSVTVTRKVNGKTKTLGTAATKEAVVSTRAIQDLGYRFASASW